MEFYFKAEKCSFKEYKTLLRLYIDYCSQYSASVSGHGNWSENMETRGHKKKNVKGNKKVKDFCQKESQGELGSTTLLERGMGCDLIKTFNIK